MNGGVFTVNGGFWGSTVASVLADLVIVKSDSADPVLPGTAFSYQLAVSNLGPGSASDLVVTDTLPTEVAFVTVSGASWSCGETGGVITCTLPGLSPGDAPVIVIDVTAPGGSATLNNTAGVTTSTSDPVTANNSDPATTEVDATPPRVATVGSAADTGDGRISGGEFTRTAITQITAAFSEAVADPPGDTDPDDVTNPANYLLLASGDDGLFATTSCAGGVDPSDLQVPIDQVSFDEPSATAFALLAGTGTSLPIERYRLLVCGSTSIVDLVGQALDGDGDGFGGDDHALDFTVWSSSLLLNPNFDGDLGHWTATSPAPGEIDHAWQDADGISTSEAARIVNTSGPDGLFYLQQCVSAAAGQFHRLGALIRTASTTPGAPIATGVVDFFTGADCSGSVAASLPTGTITGDTAGLWENDLGGLVQAPPGTQSARVWLVLDAGASPDFTTDIDNTHFFDSGFFADDFESGDTTAWSSTAGGTP